MKAEEYLEQKGWVKMTFKLERKGFTMGYVTSASAYKHPVLSPDKPLDESEALTKQFEAQKLVEALKQCE